MKIKGNQCHWTGIKIKMQNIRKKINWENGYPAIKNVLIKKHLECKIYLDTIYGRRFFAIIQHIIKKMMTSGLNNLIILNVSLIQIKNDQIKMEPI